MPVSIAKCRVGSVSAPSSKEDRDLTAAWQHTVDLTTIHVLYIDLSSTDKSLSETKKGACSCFSFIFMVIMVKTITDTQNCNFHPSCDSG